MLLCLFATLQKAVIGAPLVLKGYVVPFVFGGISGGIGGFYISLLKEYNQLLHERVNSLEKILPICSHCKKIREQGADPEDINAWIPVEAYISSRTSAQFSHSICPDCMEKLYGSSDHELA